MRPQGVIAPTPRKIGIAGITALLAVLGACSQTVRTPSVTAPPANAIAAGIAKGPGIASLGMNPKNAASAFAAFQTSCPRLVKRTDNSGLTHPSDWQAACNAARSWPAGNATGFFASHFKTVRIGSGEAFATGYYEPEIAGSRTPSAEYQVPVYGLPADLVRARPGDAAPNANGQMPLGRYDKGGRFAPYYTRGEIEDGAIRGAAPIIGWAADPVELYFLQIQGSGRLIARDGSVMRIGYAGQNGRAFTSLGAVMRGQGLIGNGPGQYPASMQGIMRYIRENPAEGRALMRADQSWVFFREITGDGPLGALGVPVTGHSSVAADPAFVPLGAPVWLFLDRKEANGLWVAQDTGGAIKGANRFDTFWGTGTKARTVAGGLSGRGSALVLIPNIAFNRLGPR